MDSRRKRIRFYKKVLRKGKSKLMHSKIGIATSSSIERGTSEFNKYESYTPLSIIKPPKFLEELSKDKDTNFSKLVSAFCDACKFEDISDEEILECLERSCGKDKNTHKGSKDEGYDIRYMYPDINIYNSEDIEKLKSFINQTQGKIADLFDVPREFLNTHNANEIKVIQEIYKLIHESSEKIPEGLQFKESLIWCVSDLLTIPELQSSIIVKQNYLDMEDAKLEDAIFYTLRNDTGRMLRSALHNYRIDELVIGFLYFRLNKPNKRIEYKLYDYQNYISKNDTEHRPELPANYAFKRWPTVCKFEPIKGAIKITNGSEENLNEKTEENS